MAQTQESRNYGQFPCCGPMRRHGRSECGFGFGIILILVGAIWLASELGWLTPALVWPVIFLAAGTIVLAFNLARRGRYEEPGEK